MAMKFCSVRMSGRFYRWTGALRASLSTQRASIGVSKVPKARNEPMLEYRPGSAERTALTKAMEHYLSNKADIPCIVHGKPVKTGVIKHQVMPTHHSHQLCSFHELDADTSKAAVQSCLDAKEDWEELPFVDRAAIFLKAADLISTKYRADICARTCLGQGKNAWQAEIDAAAETCDFLRFNVGFAEQLYATQPEVVQSTGVWNRMEYRALEGFLVAISPFNFTAIGANLPCAPVLLGNTCVWKPSNDAVLSNYLVYQVLEEAGLPPGVINFLPGDGAVLGEYAFSHPEFAGLHFTGSTRTFHSIWTTIAGNLDRYRSYPRIVGETGGKNFHFVHASANIPSAVHNTIRGAFEYQGQKCSATSRAYIPSSKWPEFRDLLVEQVRSIKQGCVTELDAFVTAVINRASFDRITGYIERAKLSDACDILVGGGYDDSKGYFVDPTVILTTDPEYETMTQEIFGPVLTIFVYDDAKYQETLKMCQDSTFGLTGALFAGDRYALELGTNMLRNAAGNFYINDKSTGAVVGQQAFGGGRKSGTNDKSGSAANLMRWVNARTIKENFLPLQHYSYPHMAEP